jgi:membrane-bound inhibitor of C-type lysozyme
MVAFAAHPHAPSVRRRDAAKHGEAPSPMLCSPPPTPLEHRMSSRFLALSIVALAVLGGCKTGPTQEEIEAAKNTVDCERPGERIVIRFDEGEARLVMPDGTRVVLYQVPMASGIRYLNGLMELRGKGMNLELIRDQQLVHLTCKPYEIPKK